MLELVFEHVATVWQYLKNLGLTVAFIIEGVHGRHQQAISAYFHILPGYAQIVRRDLFDILAQPLYLLRQKYCI